MVRIPYQDNYGTELQGENPYQKVSATPDAFGSGVGTATTGLGQGMDKINEDWKKEREKEEIERVKQREYDEVKNVIVWLIHVI